MGGHHLSMNILCTPSTLVLVLITLDGTSAQSCVPQMINNGCCDPSSPDVCLGARYSGWDWDSCGSLQKHSNCWCDDYCWVGPDNNQSFNDHCCDDNGAAVAGIVIGCLVFVCCITAFCCAFVPG